MSPVSMEKIQREAPALVSLAKQAQASVTAHGLDGQKAKVAVVIDASGSMSHLYRSGAVQKAVEKVLAVATQFDDDGDIDVFFFHDKAWHVGSLSISDYVGGVDRLFNGDYGGTKYHTAIEAVTDHYFPKRVIGSGGDKSMPVYAAFFTDGATRDEDKALKAAKKSSENPIFFQSIGLGNEREFYFLEGKGRGYDKPGQSLNSHGGKVDNFGYVTYPDITRVSDTELLDGLLNEFPGWLPKARQAGVLK